MSRSSQWLWSSSERPTRPQDPPKKLPSLMWPPRQDVNPMKLDILESTYRHQVAKVFCVSSCYSQVLQDLGLPTGAEPKSQSSSKSEGQTVKSAPTPSTTSEDVCIWVSPCPSFKNKSSWSKYAIPHSIPEKKDLIVLDFLVNFKAVTS